MKQQDFENHYSQQWDTFQSLLETTGKDTKQHQEFSAFPELYRNISHQLAIAKQRRYSAGLIHRLNQLVVLGHERFYGDLPRYQAKFLYYLFFGFPQTLRANARFVWLALALFVLPGFLFFYLCLTSDEVIYSLLPYEQVKEFEQMYEPDAKTFGRKRESDTDIYMFCYYIQHNISISFQTFAGGVALGLGSIFFLVYNGIFMGAIAGHITQVGFTETFFPFVIGHGAFELTAIALAGAAGLKLGWSLISPGNLSRLSSLKVAAQEAIVIIYGSTVMLLIAAFLEAFWSSSSTLPIAVKYGVGSVFWLLVVAYILFAGRHRYATQSI
ncbi:hypothetical protein TDB9533_04546 [Thalassocella blandensis]|nr:hypothetical protein TDB9533_04546 [Thalassocella blandensis]